MSHAAEFDEYGHKDHGHVIVSLFTLRFVLAALLFCTLATSGSAWAEQFIADTFHVEIPQWVNAAVALSIAVVKTVLVVTFFMQLKYDNPMNTIIFVFTLLTVFSFLGFTSLDLGNRDSIDRFKNQYAQDGGDLGAGGPIFDKDVVPGESIVERAKRIAMARQANYESELKSIEKEMSELAAARDTSPQAMKKLAELRKKEESIREELEHKGYDPRKVHHHEAGLDIADSGFIAEKPAKGSSSNISRPIDRPTMGGAAAKPAAEAPAHGH
jgi:cytochrome c oxidase subunit 4